MRHASPSPITQRTPLPLALFITLLIVIGVMLTMVSANLHAYHLQKKSAEKHLQTVSQLLVQYDATGQSIDNLPPLPENIHLFYPRELPTDLMKRLQTSTPIVLPRSTLKKLGWKLPNSGAVIVDKLPNAKVQTLIAMTMPSRELRKIFVYAGLYLSLALFGIMLCYAFLAHSRTMRRLKYISNAADEIMAGNIAQRIPINPAVNDEYRRLSETLNAVFDKNAQLMQELRQVNNNIAHDLKSPLNRMRSRMEVALLNSRTDGEYEQALSQSISDVDDLLKTFQALLLMGNLDSKARNYQLARTSLSDLAEKLGELYEAVAEDKSQTFTMTIAEDVHVFANSNLLAQAISNVLDNAIKYTPAGGKVDFTLQKQGETALLVICDNGRGIPAEKRQAVFERFTRLDSARQLPGTGLGMSLVLSILKVHNATIQLHENQPGLRVEIRLRSLS